MQFFTKDVILGSDGKPMFIGKDQPSPQVKSEKGAQMQCPVCKGWFDYLIGEDINGGVRGCETCWKPPRKGEGNGGQTERPIEEVIS